MDQNRNWNQSWIESLAVKLGFWVLICALVSSVSAIDHCHCDDGFWSVQSIMECQKVSDFLIAIAYFSIPIELLYFISCSSVPFKWVLVQFIAFIVLCGLTHLLNGWTYYGPHSFQLMLSLTIAKISTALVSLATAITLFTLIPLILKVKVREIFLRQNVLELDQEIGMMKKQKEASWHVRMLTQEIRKSLDKHTILYTTLVELSNTLDLQNCAVWMPNENNTQMNLTHELKMHSSSSFRKFISINDPDVLEIINNKGVRVLNPDSALGAASGGGTGETAAIRMPLLHVSNFKGGTPEFVETSFAILVLVLSGGAGDGWSETEMEIVEVVADQVAVALSHASVLEESQAMRQRLEEQNRALQLAKENAMMASQARNSFQKVMGNGMRRPMHSMLGLFSLFQDEDNLSPDQTIIVDAMVKSSNVLSTLINDVMEVSPKENGRLPLEMRAFKLHGFIREASCLIKCMCVYQGFGFSVEVQETLPNRVVGDEWRTFQVVLHMVGHLLNVNDRGGLVIFRAVSEKGNEGKGWGFWRANASNEEFVGVKFEIEVRNSDSKSSESSTATRHFAGRGHIGKNAKEGLSFSMCRRLVQMMQGNIWVSSNSQGQVQAMTLVLKFQFQPSIIPNIVPDISKLNNLFKGVRVILADDDNTNRTVTKKLLTKLGCQVTAVQSGFECLAALGPTANAYQVVFLDLCMPNMDGYDVAMRLRKFRSRNWPLIVAITASAEDNVWEKCLKVGMNGLIRKPVVLRGIADELRRVLQHS